MKNKYYINKANKLTNKIKFSVFEYNKMTQCLSSEIDRLEENIDYYRKGYIELYDRIEEAIEYIEERKNLNWYAEGVFVYELLNILQGVDKE